MYLSNFEIQNFQIHKELKIKFTPGLNLIVGDTGSGKSSIIRALSLLLENQPRSGSKIYKSNTSKLPITLKLTDSNGNIIKRNHKVYWINNIKLKAFGGNEPPNELLKYLPFKTINWQRQLDPHYLILETGGNAAKLFNKYSGLDDQELLLNECKQKINESKSDIKRLYININEQTESINKLNKLIKTKYRLKKILFMENNMNRINIKIENLSSTLSMINHNEKFIKNFTPKMRYIDEIINEYPKLMQKIDIYFKKINIIEKVISKKYELNKINKISINTITSILKKLDNIIYELKASNDYIFKINKIILEIKKAEIDLNIIKKEIINLDIEYNKTMSNYSICPFCNTKLKK